MRLLVFGRSGQLATELARQPMPVGWTRSQIGRPDVDITDRRQVSRAVEEQAPTAVINATAYTAVDNAESEPEAAFAVNRDAAGHIAVAAARNAALMVQVSTDYVFDGLRAGFLREDDEVHPLGVYGASKEAGERAVRAAGNRHLIVRTAWVYSPFGRNFVKTMLRLMETRPHIDVVDDQHGSPTSARLLAATLLEMCARAMHDANLYGTYHLACRGEATWFQFAKAIQEEAAAVFGSNWPGARCHIRPIATVDYPTPAQRPANSRLDCSKLSRQFGLTLPCWRAELRPCIVELAHLQSRGP